MVTVVAGILQREGRLLIGRRLRGKREALKWEFPGGKLEPGELPEAGLARELLEELGIVVQVEGPVGSSHHDYPWGSLELLAYRVIHVGGAMTLHDHEEVRWVLPAELDAYDFAAADLPIVRLIRARGDTTES
jgi:8-oxo-dGTP diphosphatase